MRTPTATGFTHCTICGRWNAGKGIGTTKKEGHRQVLEVGLRRSRNSKFATFSWPTLFVQDPIPVQFLGVTLEVTLGLAARRRAIAIARTPLRYSRDLDAHGDFQLQSSRAMANRTATELLRDPDI